MNTWLLLVVLSLAVYRLTRLVVKDTLPPALWLRDRLAGGWRKPTEDEWRTIRNPGTELANPVQSIDGQAQVWIIRAGWSPDWLAELITCPWCASGWVSGGLVGLSAWLYSVPAPLLMWPAVWGAGALLASREWA